MGGRRGFARRRARLRVRHVLGSALPRPTPLITNHVRTKRLPGASFVSGRWLARCGEPCCSWKNLVRPKCARSCGFRHAISTAGEPSLFGGKLQASFLRNHGCGPDAHIGASGPHRLQGVRAFAFARKALFPGIRASRRRMRAGRRRSRRGRRNSRCAPSLPRRSCRSAR